MANRANSIPAPGVHGLSGSSPPGAGTPPPFEPVAGGSAKVRSRPHPRREPRPGLRLHPMGLRDVSDEADIRQRADHLLMLLKQEAALARRIDTSSHQQDEHPQRCGFCKLERSMDRLVRRILRLTTELCATKAPNQTSMAAKANVYVEMAIAGLSSDEDRDELGLSLAHDALHLGLEAACLPRGHDVFSAYHREILAIHEKMAAPQTTEAEDERLMARWGEIDHMALADRPRTFADAIGALEYASREHHQFKIENHEADKGERLVQHLVDGALAVLSRVVQQDAAEAGLRQGSDAATIAEMAALDFEPIDFGDDFTLPTEVEWAGLSNPNLISARVALKFARMSKAKAVEVLASLIDGEGDKFAADQSKHLSDAEDFFGGLHRLLQTGSTRYLIAAAEVAQQRGEVDVEQVAPKPELRIPDRRAVAAYREWLHYEGRLLGLEMFPRDGAGAERFVPVNTASTHYHFPEGGSSWRDLPTPSSRAEAMCKVLGIDWTTDEARDENFMPIASEGDNVTGSQVAA